MAGTPKRIGIFFLFLVLHGVDTSAQARNGNIYALVVGVSEYTNPSNNLNYPDKDAAEIYDLLRANTSADKVKILTDRSATHDNILKTANQLFLNAGSNDIVILFFSGHGYQGGFIAHDKVLKYDELKILFRKTRAKRKVVFADACFSGDMRANSAPQNAHFTMFGNQVCLFLSSRSDQVSFESGGIGNGFFSYYLVLGLRGGADANRDRLITARELFEFVNPRVRQYSYNRQVPVMWGKFDDAMVVLDWNK